MNIYEKLVEVRKNIDGFNKDATGYGYKYVSGSQVLSKIKDTMDKQKIILETHLLSPVVIATGKGSLVTSPMKMIWVNAEKPEDRITIDWFMTGEQKDPSQALGSGLTYSERYFLLKFFGVATDEDDPDKIIGKTTSNPKTEPKAEPIDIDKELKKQLIKKHGGDKVKAKAEYDKIKAKESKEKIENKLKKETAEPEPTEPTEPGLDEFDKDMGNYIEEKFEMEGASK
jgi:hypothetical protein